MALQYIGARYVPRFMGTHDNTQVYEALDVVDNGLGTSYIAKIPVPAGTPLTNTTYWAIYGASSGAIINLQNQIGDLTDLDTVDQDNLVDAINEITNEVLANSFKCVLIGDSFATVTNSDGKTMFELAEELSGRDCIVSAVAGAGFYNATPSLKFITQLQGIADNANVKDIYVIGGANDVQAPNATTLYNEISDFMDYAKAHFVNAKVHVGYAGYHWNNLTYFTASHDVVIPTYKRIEELGGEFIKDFASVLHSDTLTYDSLHPTSDGVTKLGVQLARVLMGSPIDSLIEIILTPADVTGESGITVNYFNVTETINNDQATISNYQMGYVECDFSPVVSISTFTPIVTCSKNAIFPTENSLNSLGIECLANVYHQGGSVTQGTLYFFKKYNQYYVVPIRGDFSNTERLKFAFSCAVSPSIKV